MRVPRSQVRYLRAARIVEEGERPTVIAQFEGIDHAFHNLLAYGAHAEVLAPQALRERIAAEAAETAALYASPKTGPSWPGELELVQEPGAPLSANEEPRSPVALRPRLPVSA